MRKQCSDCRFFERTGTSPYGEFKDGGICCAYATDRYAQAGSDSCDLYQECMVKGQETIRIEKAMVDALIKAAEDGSTAETILHMVWFCEYLMEITGGDKND